MKLNCIIVDDEPLALDILEDHIRRTPSLDLVGRFTSGTQALRRLEDKDGEAIDLAFLDIQMPGLGGIELARTIGGQTRVVFTTAFPQYALDGFRVDALDYLLKPISFAEFTRSVEKAAEWFRIKRTARQVADITGAGQAIAPYATGNEPRTLIVRSDYKQFVIPLDSIVYIEGIRDYIRIHTLDADGTARAVQTLMNMKTVEEMLPRRSFARVHRSWIVNLDRIKRIERGHIVFDAAPGLTPIAVPISDTYKESFLGALAARSL